MNHIINPIDGVKYSLFSEIGKNIFKNYLNAFKSGGSLYATRTGPLTVRISPTSFSTDARDGATIPDIDDRDISFDNIFKGLETEPSTFEDRAALAHRPPERYSERYDRLNNKLNKMWKHHVDNRMSYFNYAIDMGLITNERVARDIDNGIDIGVIALACAVYFFNNGEWLDNNAIEYYGLIIHGILVQFIEVIHHHQNILKILMIHFQT